MVEKYRISIVNENHRTHSPLADLADGINPAIYGGDYKNYNLQALATYK
jgi:hypothetical protein